MANLFNTDYLGGVPLFTYSNTTDDVSTQISQALNDYYDKSQTDFLLNNKLDTSVFDACFNDLGNTFVSKGGDTMTGDYNLIGDLFIDGSLNIMGGATTIQTQIVEISNNKMTLNSNLIGSPPPTLQSGIIVNRGNQTDYEFIFDESSNTFVVGQVGDLQPVATREYTPINQRIPYWDVSETRFKTDRNAVLNSDGSITASNFTTGAISLTGVDTALGGKQNTITGGATTITTSDLTTNRALISNGSGKVAVSSITSTELGYLSGTTYGIQTQLNEKLNKTGGTIMLQFPQFPIPTLLTIDTGHLNITNGGQLRIDGVDKLALIDASLNNKSSVGHTHPISDVINLQTTLDGKQATITGGATTITSSDLTASRALVSNSSGKVGVSTATATELGYVSGTTSSIQTQLNGKQATITGGASTITSSNLTANRALISNGSGKVAVSSITSTELGYLSGATSNLQSQINSIGGGGNWDLTGTTITNTNNGKVDILGEYQLPLSISDRITTTSTTNRILTTSTGSEFLFSGATGFGMKITSTKYFKFKTFQTRFSGTTSFVVRIYRYTGANTYNTTELIGQTFSGTTTLTTFTFSSQPILKPDTYAIVLFSYTNNTDVLTRLSISPTLPITSGAITANQAIIATNGTSVGGTDNWRFFFNINFDELEVIEAKELSATNVAFTGNIKLFAPSATTRSIIGKHATSSSETEVILYEAGTGNCIQNIKLNTSTEGQGRFRFLTRELERMTILNNGNVGIGITLPTYTLDVNGAVRTNSRLFADIINRMFDTRQLKPSDIGGDALRFGFGTWNNNNNIPYADVLHMSAWGDSSGGKKNALMLSKDTPSIRLWQGDFGSTANYSTYRDCVMAESNGAVNTKCTNNAVNSLQVELPDTVDSNWRHFRIRGSSYWGDGITTFNSANVYTSGTLYGTVEPIMFRNPHIVSNNGGTAAMRWGRAGGVSTGTWWETGTRTDGRFHICREATTASQNTVIIGTDGSILGYRNSMLIGIAQSTSNITVSSTSATTIVSFTVQPYGTSNVRTNSTFYMKAYGRYSIGGNGTDAFRTSLETGPFLTPTLRADYRQEFLNAGGGGSRSVSLLPIEASWTVNTTGSPASFIARLIGARSSADDNIIFYSPITLEVWQTLN